ncbi:MAG: hypothetical protein N4A68_17275 [Maledivibacter sp.]|jgi:hypothetical protein|nr:hypothetical protein [Maledivibacter sp.]
MELFKCSNVHAIKSELIGNVETPLGNIVLDFNVEDRSTCNIIPSKLYTLLNGRGYIGEWITKKFRAELLLCRPNISTPYHTSVQGYWAGMWRVGSYTDINQCFFSSTWRKGFSWNYGGINSGEGLECQIWDDGKTSVAIGTEDGQRLIVRASKNDYFPERFEKEINPYNAVTYSREGLVVPIHNLHNNDILQIQFIIAWSKEDIPAWFAVDMDGKKILESVMCT